MDVIKYLFYMPVAFEDRKNFLKRNLNIERNSIHTSLDHHFSSKSRKCTYNFIQRRITEAAWRQLADDKSIVESGWRSPENQVSIHIQMNSRGLQYPGVEGVVDAAGYERHRCLVVDDEVQEGMLGGERDQADSVAQTVVRWNIHDIETSNLILEDEI